ncbi:ABC transporter ATP-binding protein [Burkholderia multivorans]|uniref:Fe3+/spermidine/putrescine ABC transporter ATP-binding protein n=1 Tax=Burkholderia multivorans TaxID=87883 RepID=A0A8E2RVR2_9BURK|nr:ABC transporter ATP-binding protein [Burkholderia multivorans]EKS9916423.1 ABC transporter ATP-binding protein [Burkholderia multivorans]MBH9662956.1 ABC transporter ATP-binding protein [Burkholderia multivorans]MBU9251304.1 ABC transporter ATP-binding protein [Burkholderia multivorans]MBU9255857.1 ABC transporter ATP-binding protein [Burkholderia multivorans]MBU9370849.1 ABC transporter ATP-binding protein [Burkholderia multivorans]
MSFLTLQHVSKRYGDFTAIEQLDLSVERGELLSLLGPSGCGKTTTLQMIAGFVAPSAGRVTLDGRDITHERPEKRGIGVVFQSYALFPHMTVAGNVGFGLEMRKMKRAQREERIAEALALVRLDGLDARYPKELSGGQRQRVAIARAIAMRPELLLLDEPMSNLDAKLREEMHIELRAIQKRLGITTILVTHDQVEAMTMSDRIAVMHRGRIAQLSTPFDAYERPATPFASVFLGRTNTFEGEVLRRNPRCAEVAVASTTLHVPHEGRDVAGPVNVYIRPEKMRLANGDARLHGRVATRVFVGNQWLLVIDTALGKLHVTQSNTGAPPPDEGSEVGLAWADDDLRMLTREGAHGHA